MEQGIRQASLASDAQSYLSSSGSISSLMLNGITFLAFLAGYMHKDINGRQRISVSGQACVCNPANAPSQIHSATQVMHPQRRVSDASRWQFSREWCIHIQTHPQSHTHHPPDPTHTRNKGPYTHTRRPNLLTQPNFGAAACVNRCRPTQHTHTHTHIRRAAQSDNGA